MTLPCPSLTAFDFQHAIALLDKRRPLTPPTYSRRKVLASTGTTCPLCLTPYGDQPNTPTFPVVATCLHTFLGGPLTLDNLFVCCRRCQQARASADLLTHAHLPDDLRFQRDTVLQLSTNHLVPLPPSTTLPAYRDALRARHVHPRSRVYAAQADDGICLLGVSQRYGDDQSKGLAHLLAKWAGTPLLRNARLTIYLLTDDDFRRVAWQLIESNAWLVGVGRRTVPRDFLDYWWVSSASVSELRSRKVAGVHVPQSVQHKEVSASAIRMRRMAARRRAAAERTAAETELRIATWEYDQLLERRQRSSSTAFPTDPDVGAEIANRWARAYARMEQINAAEREPRPSPGPVAG